MLTSRTSEHAMISRRYDSLLLKAGAVCDSSARTDLCGGCQVTGIPTATCILVLKKCKKPDDVLFINASEYFEKGKRQNRLREDDIDKIVDTYQFRREEERYSRRVSMDKIETNGYNLNISRYISTAQQEVEVDLQAVHGKLVEIEQKIVDATRKHNEFLKELGLPFLPLGS
jgi:type I restriction enzyme M protein